jgi:hypothetical protein
MRGSPNPGYHPGSRSCFHPATASFLWRSPISRAGTHHLTARPKGRGTAPAIGVAAAVTIPRVMDALQSAVCHVNQGMPASYQPHEAGLRMWEAATGRRLGGDGPRAVAHPGSV